jgi:hypothetical protein
MDMSETCHGFYGILDKSDKIYTLYDNTANIGRAVISHYRRLLKAKEYESILSKTIEFSLPYDIDRGCGQIENLTASPIGSYMKGIV